MGAQMPPAGPTVPAVTARDMSFGRDTVAELVIVDAGTQRHDAPDELVADDEPGRDRALGPLVPLVDMQVGAADRRLLDLDQHLVGADLGNRHLLHPDAFLGEALHQRPHRLTGHVTVPSGLRGRLPCPADACGYLSTTYPGARQTAP